MFATIHAGGNMAAVGFPSLTVNYAALERPSTPGGPGTGATVKRGEVQLYGKVSSPAGGYVLGVVSEGVS